MYGGLGDELHGIFSPTLGGQFHAPASLPPVEPSLTDTAWKTVLAQCALHCVWKRQVLHLASPGIEPLIPAAHSVTWSVN